MEFKDYFKEVDKQASVTEKISAIKENYTKASRLNAQIMSLSSISSLKKGQKSSEKLPKPLESKKEIEEKTDIEFETLYNKICLLDLTNLTEEEINAKISEILLSANIPSQTYLAKLKIRLYNEIVTYSGMAPSATSEEDLDEIRRTIKDLQKKISLLNEFQEEKELTESVMSDNKIFFLTTDAGNILALESLRKNVPKEYYPQFKELLLGLKRGELKGLKKFMDIPYFEVRDFKIRITFDKLSGGNYIIIDAFMKKADTTSYINSSLHNRAGLYLKKKSYYLENHQNEDFIREHEGYLAEVLTLLGDKELEEGISHDARTI